MSNKTAGYPQQKSVTGQTGNWRDEFAFWFFNKFGGVADIYCDEKTGELVAVDYCKNELIRKPFENQKPLVCQADEPTKEQVAAGVCLWRKTSDMCLYTVKVNDDGTCEWYSSDQKIEAN